MTLFNAIMNCPDSYDCKVVESYSGRGMYGADCFSLYTDNQWTANQIQEWLDAEDLPRGRRDGMGCGSVLYWPSVTLQSLTPSELARWQAYRDERDADEEE
jgi:hypothetical protein